MSRFLVLSLFVFAASSQGFAKDKNTNLLRAKHPTCAAGSICQVGFQKPAVLSDTGFNTSSGGTVERAIPEYNRPLPAIGEKYVDRYGATCVRQSSDLIYCESNANYRAPASAYAPLEQVYAPTNRQQ